MANKPFRVLTVAALLCAAAGLAPAQQAARITPNFKDADIGQVIEAVSAATGKNIIIDPRVRAQVTMLSSTPMSPDAFYEAFQALLQVHGFVALPSGNVIKVVPDSSAKTSAGNDLPGRVSRYSDEFVTQIVGTKNVSAAQLVSILRPLMPQSSHLVAYPPTNILILSDRANNISRMLRIIERIDQTSDSDFQIVPLSNASATEIVRVMGALIAAQAQGEGGTPTVRLVADDRTNSVLMSGDKSQVLKYKARIAYLDQPLENGGDTQVRYLQYADAEKIAGKLKEQLSGSSAGTPGAAGAAAVADRSATIWAEPETNALVITAPPKTMRSLMSVVDRLDIRRAQVHVEAIVVEVEDGKSAELGVNWVANGAKDDKAAGGFIEPVGGVSIIDLARAANDPSTLSAIPRGTTLAVGRIGGVAGIDFAAVLRALRGDAKTNIIATPSLTVLDNQEAQIKVTQEVPFVTGQFTNTGGNNNGSVNPFQTIQRQEVGTILKITPQINVGDSVTLKIEQESSSLAASSAGAVDLITNKRTINTTVIIEDAGTVVLGGLISDEDTRGEQRVPFLGRIPIIGEAFRTRSAKRTKKNLMVFIQPRILRDGTDTAIETNQKYNYMRNQQQNLGPRGEILPLLPGNKAAVLPEMKDPPPPKPAPTPAPTPAPKSAPAPEAAPKPDATSEANKPKS
jgi:general secretion pathway protein D